MSADPATLRAVLSGVPTSVAVVTGTEGGEPYGVTIGSLGRLSAAPPLVLFCVARHTRSHTRLSAADRYCISILAHHQADVADRFAHRAPDRFATGMFQLDGLPAVAGATAWLLCTRHDAVPAGDHTIVIARVERATRGSGSPLVYQRRSYWGLTGGAAGQRAMRVGGKTEQLGGDVPTRAVDLNAVAAGHGDRDREVIEC